MVPLNGMNYIDVQKYPKPNVFFLCGKLRKCLDV